MSTGRIVLRPQEEEVVAEGRRLQRGQVAGLLGGLDRGHAHADAEPVAVRRVSWAQPERTFEGFDPRDTDELYGDGGLAHLCPVRDVFSDDECCCHPCGIFEERCSEGSESCEEEVLCVLILRFVRNIDWPLFPSGLAKMTVLPMALN